MESSSPLRSKNLTSQQPSSSSKPSETLWKQAELVLLSKRKTKPSNLWNSLDEYQKKAVLFAAPLDGAALFFEQGTGKTWIAMGLIDFLEVDTVLLIVPLTNLRSTWVKNIREQLPDYQIAFNWEEFKKLKGKRILLINYEAMPSVIKKIQKFQFDFVCFDESQKLKSRSSRNSRYARRFRNHKKRLILSGTPMDKSPIDVWAQMRFVDHRILGENWKDFADVYCKRGGFMNKKWIFQDDMLSQFLARVSACCLRVEKADVLDTPKPKIHIIKLPLLGEQRRLYEKMDQDMVAKFEGSRIKADLVITRNVKLQQITGGFIRTDDEETLRVGSAKARKLDALLKKKTLQLPLVIFCKYTPEIAIIRTVVKRHYKRIGILSGKVKDRKNDLARTRLQEDFQSGKLDVLICQLRTGGVGIDLFRSHVAIYYSFNHSWIDFDQSVSRLDRRGQTKRVELFLLTAQDTIDEDILEAIHSKRSLTQVVLQKLKRRRSHG